MVFLLLRLCWDRTTSSDWKLVVKQGVPHLYDLATDIHEDRDVAAEHPDIVKQMKEIIRKEHRPNDLFKVTLPDFDK